MNLESLRRKRVHRMGVKANGHPGQRRIFFVLDRATRKFHGDVGLWLQYLEFARQKKASKKVSQILTSMLRLHPTRAELWIYAANYAMDERRDMTEARSYMHRGLRFCKHSRNLWIEYTRLEMVYMAKIAARRQVLGLEEESSGKSLEPSIDLADADILTLPNLTASGVDPTQQTDDPIEEGALQKLSATPALSGAIPIAIFNAAMNNFEGDASLGEEIFDMVADFHGIPCASNIQHHIVNVLCGKTPTSPATLICFIREPVIDVEILSSDFPRALKSALDRLSTALQRDLPFPASLEPTRARMSLINRVVDWILPFLDVPELDQDIRKVLTATLKKLLSQWRTTFQHIPRNNTTEIGDLATKLLDNGFKDLAKPLVAFGLQMSPNESRLLSLQNQKV